MSSDFSTILEHSSHQSVPVPSATLHSLYRRSDVILSLSPSYKLVIDLPRDSRGELRSLLGGAEAEAVLVPLNSSSASVIPLTRAQRPLFEALNGGCTYETVISEISAETINRLIVLGILRGHSDAFSLSGPALALMLREDTETGGFSSIQTDQLSAKCLSHVARMPLLDVNSVTTRLYLFNHFGVYDGSALNRTTEDIKQVLSRQIKSFVEVPPPPMNPGWHFFSKTGPRVRCASAESSGCKVYLSPHVADTAECLSRLLQLLPFLQCYSWKIGRGAYGAGRPDKICLYFHETSAGMDAAATLQRELKGIRTQGIPFTHRLDPDGLVSIGWDPPSSSIDSEQGNLTSWRDWIAKKIASALLLAKTSESYPLSPEQTALWSLKLLGVDPSSWRVQDPAFWRN